jgi:sensor histidine kinase YesM
MLVTGIWFSLRVQDYASPSLAMSITIIKVVDIALMIYITNYILIPRLLYKKKYAWFVIIFIAMVLITSLIKMNILGRMTNNPALYHWEVNFKQRLYDNILPHFFLVIAGAAFKLMLDYGKLQQRMAETAKEKAEAELNFLKSQMNPHFLFNSLNSVYFLIKKDNTQAREALHKFSGMLRYQLYETNGDKIPVEKEIQYLKDYMDLQQLRKDEKYNVKFTCSPAVKGFSIEPLLLVPFVENAFKHISHFTDNTNFVDVDLKYNEGVFHFSVLNSKEINNKQAEHSGIGLVNVRRRLELLYPSAFQLDIDEKENRYQVQLTLKI